jgi:succinyldiaminopimelate transaminase
MKIDAELQGVYIGFVSENKRIAMEHPDGLIDLSGGSPSDDTPDFIRKALFDGSNAHGYTPARGTAEFRTAAVDWLARATNCDTVPESSIIPIIGSKELLTLLPLFLGIGEGDTIIVPELAYPSYPVGVALAGADEYRLPHGELPPEGVTAKLMWINSPNNPTGAVLGADYLRALLAWAREHDCVIAADECYIEFGWFDDERQPVSILDPAVSGGDHTNIIAVYSMSKRSNIAGYRVGFITGDPAVLGPIMRLRDYTGLMVPTPVLAAATAALRDDEHVAVQATRYRQRQARMRDVLTESGFTVAGSEGGVFLWATRGERHDVSARWFAEHGIAVTEGDGFGPAGLEFVRIALTATDAKLDEAIARLRGGSFEAPEAEPALGGMSAAAAELAAESRA